MEKVTSDSETLHTWLCRNGWICRWQNKAPQSSPVKYFSLYVARDTGNMIIVQNYKEKRDGWNYFIMTKNHAISDCLAELKTLAEKVLQ